SFALKWEQSTGGAAQLVGGGGDPVILQVLATESEEPVRWTYEGVEQSAKAIFADGTEVGFDPLNPQTNSVVGTPNGNGVSNANYTVQLASDPCASRTFHVQLANRAETVRVANLRVEIETADETCPTDGPTDGGINPVPEDCECAATGSSSARPTLFSLAALFGLVALLGRRRRR